MSMILQRVILLSLIVLCWTGCAPDKESPTLQTISGRSMGTQWHLHLPKDLDLQSDLASSIQGQLDALENIFSNWKEDSAVSKFNAALTTDWISVPREVVILAEHARYLSEITQGSFDVTLHPILVELGFQNESPSSSPRIPRKIITGYQYLEFRSNPSALRKTNPEIQVNFSALVEGYAIDQISNWLRSQGLSNFLFELGGEFYAAGRPSPAKKWKIGIEHPDPKIKEPYAVVELENEALSTSGTYRQFKVDDSGTYSHILDGRTRAPKQNSMVSVSVKAKKSFIADGFATALLTQNEQDAKELCQKHQISALFIRQQKQTWNFDFERTTER